MNAPLVDTQGRIVRDLRISVTDRCNLRCVYCMPAEGMPWLPKGDLLTYEEIARFAGVCLTLGVTGIRLTGGEPTVRADLPVLVRMLGALRPGLDLSHTWSREKLVPADEILARIGDVFPIRVAHGEDPSAPATLYEYLDGGGRVGVIASVTRPFCGHCDRIRLTADGQIRTCLFS